MKKRQQKSHPVVAELVKQLKMNPRSNSVCLVGNSTTTDRVFSDIETVFSEDDLSAHYHVEIVRVDVSSSEFQNKLDVQEFIYKAMVGRGYPPAEAERDVFTQSMFENALKSWGWSMAHTTGQITRLVILIEQSESGQVKDWHRMFYGFVRATIQSNYFNVIFAEPPVHDTPGSHVNNVLEYVTVESVD